MSIERKRDPWGRTVFKAQDAFELEYRGFDTAELIFEPDPLLDQYNELCQKFDKAEFTIDPAVDLPRSPEEENKRRADRWMIPDEFRALDVHRTLLDMCSSDAERDRIDMEMALYKERDLENLLRLMFSLIAHFREKNIVWGIGRGSSVASYVLYKIGVHKVDSIRYGLDIRDFLKPVI